MNAAAPSEVRSIDWYESPVGPLIARATDSALCGLSFCDADRLQERLHELRERHAMTLQAGSNRVLNDLRVQLAEYFAGQRQTFTMSLRSPGTPFQERVWAALCEIPYGETWSYLQLAVRIGDALATRAVGYANGANPIAIVIPCHRVINADGGDGGYGGGLWRKRILLDLERGQGSLAL
ncbi:methylated-DNA--protein-cysteine methyltransferase [Steroidobacter agaridevorans]|uniref:Methylated-DNA--protein-cysteine methyltransferase n=1 Tax=Steroidobacter agaridevorans TaxID=2695856 RepID=A0A829YD61_9GAMM|nr:methylated-DNA--[protein]-cysteine S-methyltransferase [Steroidobacter agaridevorans]GFE81209.1 methylated-DNA--protein-cysteine methyltransferase [Steroidobacter agaridevorans]GFE88907.1 methylated-DNA--protein-cysteine methyltransferase [Steroidobacter agaridevorans]